MRLARPGLFVLFSLTLSLSAHAALVPGPERAIQPGTLSGVWGQPVSVVTDGTDFLTLWRDYRPGRRGVYATVVNEEGASRPLAPRPILLGEGYAGAVWTGSSYLVLATSGAGTVVAHLDRDAQILGESQPLASDKTFVGGLAWNGHVALAILGDANGNRTLTFLDAAGNVVRPVKEMGLAYTAAIATAGDAFIVTWAELLESTPDTTGPPVMTAHTMRISASGDAGPAIELVPPTRTWLGVAAASGSRDAGVIVVADDASPTRTLSRFTIDGTTSAIEADPVFTLDALSASVGVVPTPAGFAVFYLYYDQASHVQLGRISFGSNVRRPVAIAVRGLSYGAAIATNGRTSLLVLEDSPIAAARFDAALTMQTGAFMPVAASISQQTTPVIRAGGENALYVWTDAGALKAALFDRDGNALSAAVTLTSNPADAKAAAVFTGSVWLVAWQETSYVDSHVLVRRLSPSGALLDATPIDAGEGDEPALASNGSIAVLATAGTRNKTGIVLHRFSAEGALLDATTNAAFVDRAYRPAIATNGSEFLLTWTQNPAYPGPYGVFGRRLTATGIPIEAAPIAIARNVGSMHDLATIASNGEDYVIAYLEYIPPPRTSMYEPETPPSHVFTKRLLGSGVLAASTADQEGNLAGEGTDPAIAASGEGFVVTFAKVNDTYAETLPLTLLATRTDAHGAALAQPHVVLRATTGSQGYSLAVAGGTPRIAYSRLSAEDVLAQRVFTRPLLDDAARRRASRR